MLAELGLSRSAAGSFATRRCWKKPWSKARRAQHLITRLAFIQAMWGGIGQDAVVLYRGAAVDGPLQEPPPQSFVSATLSREVAMAHFEGGATTQVAVLWRQRVLVARVLMTFLETRAMNGRFQEAEAVLVGDPENRPF